MNESSWHLLVELAKSLGRGIRLSEEMRHRGFDEVFFQIGQIYFSSSAVYRDETCRNLPFWKRHAYRDKAYSNALTVSFRLSCKLELEKIWNMTQAGRPAPAGVVADYLDEPWAVAEMLRRSKRSGIGLFTTVGPVQACGGGPSDYRNN